MTLLRGPTTFYTVASTVLADLVTALSDGPTDVPTRVAVVPGEIAWDDCETCGQLALAQTRSFFTDDFPQDDGALPQASCHAAWLAADFTVQLIRCAPLPDALGNPPTTKALDASAQTVMADAYTVVTAVTATLCGMVEDDLIVDYVIRAGEIVGPAGACVGSQVDFTVAVQP